MLFSCTNHEIKGADRGRHVAACNVNSEGLNEAFRIRSSVWKNGCRKGNRYTRRLVELPRIENSSVHISRTLSSNWTAISTAGWDRRSEAAVIRRIILIIRRIIARGLITRRITAENVIRRITAGFNWKPCTLTWSQLKALYIRTIRLSYPWLTESEAWRRSRVLASSCVHWNRRMNDPLAYDTNFPGEITFGDYRPANNKERPRNKHESISNLSHRDRPFHCLDEVRYRRSQVPLQRHSGEHCKSARTHLHRLRQPFSG